MNVIIIGSGYVGLTTGSALAYIGHNVTLIDKDDDKIKCLNSGNVPIRERGLKELLNEARATIRFTSDWDDFDQQADVVIIAVGTPSKENGDADLTHVEEVAAIIGQRLSKGAYPVIVNKSTVPVGTARRVGSIIEQTLRRRGIFQNVHVASNPEFLREGEALFDTFYPDRIVIGVESQAAGDVLRRLYQPLIAQDFIPPQGLPRPERFAEPTFFSTDQASAELIKYAANAFLAMKISFINEFANLAEKVGADIAEVAKGMGLDKRIGPRYLQAGIGWGGSCFGKDTRAILHTGRQYDCEMRLVQATIDSNERQREQVVRKLKEHMKALRGRTIGILGLSFKPNTDDLRDSPAIAIIRHLNELGAHVKAYDPMTMRKCQDAHPELFVEYCETAEDLFENCHAVVLATELEEFRHLPYDKLGKKMKRRFLLDGRNVLDESALTQAGFIYRGIGRCYESWEEESSSQAAQGL
ncbi:UDP-glucose dehydrogenase family protein [Brevibacillus fluminis]|uniref:UDP-glucose dehydrogenase family protein n=1 Tax=Brevibacillus fluminis TaxID=511487 RepID=UPI003F8A2CBB